MEIQAPALEGAIHLAPSDAVKSFHLSGLSPDLLRDVASAYGIRAIVDDSVEQKNFSFDLENVNYGKAMDVLMEMAHVIAVPVDETSVLVAHDLPSNRLLMERLVEETIYLPGSTQEQINDMANVAQQHLRGEAGNRSGGHWKHRGARSARGPCNDEPGTRGPDRCHRRGDGRGEDV